MPTAGAENVPTNGSAVPTTVPAGEFKMTRGIFIVTAHNTAIQPATYSNPAVDGIVIRTFWSNVQPTPDTFDWSFIDSQVQAASASGKKVILVVSADSRRRLQRAGRLEHPGFTTLYTFSDLQG